MQNTLFVFLGAGFGAVLRWRLGEWLAALWPVFPLGTMAANLLGSFAIGIAAGCFEIHAHIPHEYRLLVTTGFLGGFTTFSAFSLETMNLLSSRLALAVAVVVLKLISCLVLTYAGFALAKRFL